MTTLVIRHMGIPMYTALQRLWARWRPLLGFSGSQEYWRQRYQRGGDSGAGSGGESARFKADVLNAFVRKLGIESVVEFGCGDGRQLALASYPRYVGYDISAEAIEECRAQFADDPSKRFELVDDYDNARSDLSLSLDVIFHLVEDPVYQRYLRTLFAASSNYVALYTSNQASTQRALPHVRHRHVSSDIASMFPEFVPFDPGLPMAHPSLNDGGVAMQFIFYRRA